MDFIERLRQKPSGTKKRIAYATSAIVTLMIFGVWASVLHFGVNQKAPNATAAVANGSDADVKPLSAFWSVISNGWKGLTENIDQIKTQTQEVANNLSATSSVDIVNTDAADTQPALPATPQSESQKDVFILSGNSTDDSSTTQ